MMNIYKLKYNTQYFSVLKYGGNNTFNKVTCYAHCENLLHNLKLQLAKYPDIYIGSLGDSVNPEKDVFSYADIPNFPISTAPSHRSKLIFGLLNGVQVLIFQGRFHLYEGYSIQKVGKIAYSQYDKDQFVSFVCLIHITLRFAVLYI